MGKRYAQVIHRAFEIGIFLKGLNGVLELLGGLLLLFLPLATINSVVGLLTQNELSEDPRDLIANFLVRSAHDLSVRGQVFGGLFLLSHGLIKIGLIVALFQRKLWAYPLAMAVFGLFIVYQMYRYTLSYSAWMISLSGLDAAVILLTYLEYRNLKAEDLSRGPDR
uniref:DUF2127 domain-containing protein n=1 Tax=Desulfobacca acetoxidans TaxID=60893 RepID=A0A7C3V4F4_9BACT